MTIPTAYRGSGHGVPQYPHRFGAPVAAAMMLAMLVLIVPSRAYAAPARSASGWTASASLLTLSHGSWRLARVVQSLGELRGELTVHGQGLSGSAVTATMQMLHLSWQGSKKMILPPTVSVRMRRTSVSPGAAVFSVDVQVPTLLPDLWSVVRFAVSDGHRRAMASTGVMVGGPARQTRFNTLTEPQARAFCAAHSPVPYLSYAVYIHGYFAPINTGGSDGPPVGIVLERARPVPAGGLPSRSYANGIFTGGFGLPRTGWHSAPGELGCGDGKRLGFRPVG